MSDRIHPAAIEASGYVGDGAQSLHDDGTWKISTGGGGVASVVAGTGIAVDDTDPANPVVSATGGGSTDPEVVRDTMAAALVAGSNITITPDDAGDTITIASSGGGGGSGALRGIENPADPSWGTPSAYDQEFDTDATALPTGWQWRNQTTATFEAKFGAGIVSQPSTSTKFFGIEQAIPSASSFTATLGSACTPTGSNYNGLGIYVADDTTGKAVFWALQWSAGYRVVVARWTPPTTQSNWLDQSNSAAASAMAWRIVKNSATSWTWQYSVDGIAWVTLDSNRDITTHVASPTHIGFGGWTTSPANSIAARWLRVR